MKTTLLICLHLIILQAAGQQGYVITRIGEKMEGYLKHYKSPVNNEIGIECWKEKKDRNPVRIPLSNIYEYSVNQKVKRILKDFKPFTDRNIYIDLSEADLISKGKYDLLRLSLDKPGYSSFLYIIEDSLDFLTAIPNTKDLFDILSQFIPEEYVRKFVALNGNRLSYSEVPILIHGFNHGTIYFKLKPEKIILLQASDLIEHAGELFKLYSSQINTKPRVIIGDLWKSIRVTISSEDSTSQALHTFEIKTGVLSVSISKNGKIAIIMFFPNKKITKEKLNSFLSLAYKDKMVQTDNQKFPTFAYRSNNHKYAFTISETNNLYYLLIADLPTD